MSLDDKEQLRDFLPLDYDVVYIGIKFLGLHSNWKQEDNEKLVLMC
jgi:hypothetical protein